MATHKELDVWKLSVDFVEEIYKVTQSFPGYELYGLTSQMRRAAVSVPSNIAEGAARNSVKENLQFLFIALGSLSEIETQLEISLRLGYINDKSLDEKITIIRSKLLNFIKYLKSKK